MNAAMPIAIGLTVGLGCGWALKWLDLCPVVQSILALQLSWLFASLLSAVARAIWISHRHGIAAVSFSLPEVIVVMGGLAALGGAVHGMLGVLLKGRPGLLQRRSVILGSIGGLCGSAAGALSGAGHALQPWG